MLLYAMTIWLCPTAMIKQPVPSFNIIPGDNCSPNSSKLSFACRSFDNRLIGRTSLSSFCRCFDSFSNGLPECSNYTKLWTNGSMRCQNVSNVVGDASVPPPPHTVCVSSSFSWCRPVFDGQRHASLSCLCWQGSADMLYSYNTLLNGC